MATLFDRTGFNFTDNSGTIGLLPNTAIQQINSTPALVPNQWMKDDLINDDTNGYYLNPVAPSCNTIWLSANTLINFPEISNAIFKRFIPHCGMYNNN